MQDFFITFEFSLFFAAFMIAVLIGYKEGFKRKNIVLILILLFVIVMNSLDVFSIFQIDPIIENKFAIRNVAMLYEIAAYLFLYNSILVNRRYRLFLISYFLSYISLVIFVSSTIQPLHSVYPTYSFVFGSIGVLIGILLFFYEKLNDAKAENIFRNFWFWISAGLFIFLATEIPLMSLLNYLLNKKNVVIEQVLPVMIAKQFISSFYYLTYLVGILCRMKT